MDHLQDQERLNELRHLWHSLMSHWRADKSDVAALNELSASETGVIDMVAENPEIIMREIGHSLHLPKSTLTSIIDRLERKGFLKRVISPRDKRSFGLQLSELGERTYDEHIKFDAVVWRRIMQTLDNEQECESFTEMLRKIVAGLEIRSESR